LRRQSQRWFSATSSCRRHRPKIPMTSPALVDRDNREEVGRR
jgi:hypothetical protein